MRDKAGRVSRTEVETRVPPFDVTIEVRGLEKSYLKKPVLRGIDLDIHRGTVFGYLGPNGAGKTTTVKILAGLQPEFEGQISVAGYDVRKHPREVKRRVGFVPEAAALYDGLTAVEFLDLIGKLREMEAPQLQRRIEALLEAFELTKRAHSRLGSYSKGMRQKVLLAAALLHDPEIVFLDEPLSGLDVASTTFVKELIRALADAGKTVFYCSHMMDIVERVCDRIVILHEGKIVADGSFEELARKTEDGSLETDVSLEKVFSELTGQEGPHGRVRKLLRALDIGDPS